MPLASSAKFTPLPAISEGTQVHQHIELVVDRSGSMKSFGSSIAPTLNEFISSQKQQTEQQIQELKNQDPSSKEITIYEKMVTRSLFGNINASRNSA